MSGGSDSPYDPSPSTRYPPETHCILTKYFPQAPFYLEGGGGNMGCRTPLYCYRSAKTEKYQNFLYKYKQKYQTILTDHSFGRLL